MVVAILQARMSSSRLPGKVLEPVLGVPMIMRQIERVLKSNQIDQLVVATSMDVSDVPLSELLEKDSISVFRGELDNVLQRFIGAADLIGDNVIVRLTGDCPLVDSQVLDLVISEHLKFKAEYTSNTLKPTYPDGLDVEVFNVDLLHRIADSDPTKKEIEHVTYGMYSREGFCIKHSVENEMDLSDLRWTVDIPEDLEFVRQVYSELYELNPNFITQDILQLLKTRPELSRTNLNYHRNLALLES